METDDTENDRDDWRRLGEVCKVIIDSLVLADEEKGPDDGNHRRPESLGTGGYQSNKKGLTSQGEPASPAQVATASSAKG